MTNEELSNEFSTLLNSYGSIGQFGEQASAREIVLNEYEKSVFLTQAQDIIVKSYYERTMNPQGSGFDDSSRRQADFSSLIKVVELVPQTSSLPVMFDSRSILFKLPTVDALGTSAVLLIIQEKLCKYQGQNIVKEFVVKPISHEEYDRQMSKAYGKPLKKQAWRLFLNQNTGFDVMSEVIPRDTLGSGESWRYRVRYVKRPRPIVLEDLPDNLSIDGISTETTCELHPILHMDVLMKAVELAAASRGLRPVQQTRNE